MDNRIKDFEHLKEIALNGCFDIKIVLNYGLFTRKTVYEDLNCFNSVDESQTNFRTEKQAKKYWEQYLQKHPIFFDGYN